MSLQIDLENYRNCFVKHLELSKTFYEGMSLETAIQNAATGKDHNDKMNKHQWRVGYKRCGKGVSVLLLKLKDIEQCTSFEELFHITEYVRNNINGLGHLWSYDTALRIGFNMKLYPQHVYLHRGVVIGMQKLFENRYAGVRKVSVDIFPSEAQSLKAYEIENFLCIWGKGGMNNRC